MLEIHAFILLQAFQLQLKPCNKNHQNMCGCSCSYILVTERD
ncbi:hypothetical protein HMPREF9530_02763 [Escherichia coli MS 21-1]|nr:hypothetical protein HMPREF9530_02763 [Escherichia coli MS 21-1]EFU46522.1 hypothetical protein HMPREF9539_02930 [Escherichia coli MS 110-3]